jgi:hypothetical protein
MRDECGSGIELKDLDTVAHLIQGCVYDQRFLSADGNLQLPANCIASIAITLKHQGLEGRTAVSRSGVSHNDRRHRIFLQAPAEGIASVGKNLFSRCQPHTVHHDRPC